MIMGLDWVELLRQLSDAPGVSGDEGSVTSLIRNMLPEGLPTRLDGFGNLVATLGGGSDGPRILLEAHVDEIGFIVTNIDGDGFLRFRPLGRWRPNILPGQRVTVKGERGDVHGLIGVTPPHLQIEEQPVTYRQLFIDVGAGNGEDVKTWGVRRGNFVVPYSPSTRSYDGRRLFGKSWDNRVGCALLVSVARSLCESGHDNEVILLGTVQEEVGKRGIRVAMEEHSVDVAIVLEGILGTDTPGLPNEIQSESRLGLGANLVIHDNGMIPHQALLRFVMDVAEDVGVRYQLTPAYGGNNSEIVHEAGGGTPTIVMGVPARYIHTYTGVLDVSDFEATHQLIVEVIQRMSEKVVERIVHR